MKNIIGLIIGVNLLFLSLNPLFGAEDWRFWNTDSIQGKLAEKLSAKIEGEFRFRDDMSKHYYTHADISLTYSVVKWFDASIGYRQIYSLKGEDWRDTNYPHINGTVKWNWQDWKFSNRVRFAYSMPEGADDYLEFRNILVIASPWKVTPLKLNPYASDEVFYNFDLEEWNENRLFLGLGFPIFIENIGGKIYYMYNSKKSQGEWDNYNTLGTEVSIKF